MLHNTSKNNHMVVTIPAEYSSAAKTNVGQVTLTGRSRSWRSDWAARED
jgi:hypothetical protein